jgi:hypothetical protein
MRYEETGKADYPHRLVFEGPEVGIVRAVYREAIYNLARRGNAGSISDFDASIAGWEDKAEEMAIRVGDSTSVTDRLEEFHANTGDAITEIPEATSVPAFESDDIHKRHILGQKALDLAEAIHEEAIAGSADGLEAEVAEFIEGRQEGPA